MCRLVRTYSNAFRGITFSAVLQLDALAGPEKMLGLLRDWFCMVTVRILCLTVAITCLEVIFQVIFCSFTFLCWNLVCVYHSDVQDHAEYRSTEQSTKEYRRFAYNVPYATCVPPSRCKCVQTPAHTGHNKPLYISLLALGSFITAWKIIL